MVLSNIQCPLWFECMTMPSPGFFSGWANCGGDRNSRSQPGRAGQIRPYLCSQAGLPREPIVHPSRSGGTKPPSAPTQLTMPIAAPASFGSKSGMILKTLPLPSPAAAQMTRTTAKNPTNASSWRKAERLNPPSAMISIEMEVIKPAPNLSANQPPRGRITLAIAAARAEMDVRLIAAVGKDSAASLIRDTVRAERIATDTLIDLPGEPDYSLIIVARGGENMIITSASPGGERDRKGCRRANFNFQRRRPAPSGKPFTGSDPSCREARETSWRKSYLQCVPIPGRAKR